MSLMAKANTDGSITLSCGGEALNISVVNGQLVMSAAPPQLRRPRRVSPAPTPAPPPRPKPVVIPGPPATGPRTMVRVPGFGDRYEPLPLESVRLSEQVCFEVHQGEWFETTDVWERVCSVANPRSLHFFFPMNIGTK
jgi:hypothetical protein